MMILTIDDRDIDLPHTTQPPGGIQAREPTTDDHDFFQDCYRSFKPIWSQAQSSTGVMRGDTSFSAAW